jgi:hypothetical protein
VGISAGMDSQRNLTALSGGRAALPVRADRLDPQLRALTRDWFETDLQRRIDAALERRLQNMLMAPAGLRRAA